MIPLMLMIVGIPMSLATPVGIREQPILPLFYGSIAGVIIIVLYSSYKAKKERQKDNAKRRSKK